MTGGFDSLNPHAIRGKAATYLTGWVYQSLLARSWDEPFTLYAGLAESFRVAPDRSAIEFTLDTAARWHDGRPVTADDLLFSFQELKTKGRPNHRSYYARVARAERTGERSVRFDLSPNPDGSIDRELPLILGLMPVLPKHWWQAEGRDVGKTHLDPPLGSGPYRVAVAEPGRRVVYERVPGWWGERVPAYRGHFNFDRITIDYFRDETVALEAFKAGGIDLRREPDVARWARDYDTPAVRDGRIRLVALPHGRTEWTRAVFLNLRRPPFDNRLVREAVALAFDYDWMAKSLYFGQVRPIESLYPNADLAAPAGPPSPAELALLEPFRDRLDPRAFGPAWRVARTDGTGYAMRPHLRRAMELLAQAGYRVVEGRQVGPDGTPLEAEVLYQLPAEGRMLLEWSRSLARIGVVLRPRLVDAAQFQQRLDRFQFDAITHRWVNSLSPGNEQAQYYGSAAADIPRSRNWPGLRNGAVDAAITALGQARTREELAAATGALDRALLWDFPIVPLFYSPEDRIAAWSHIAWPDRVPLYGVVLETAWDRRAGSSMAAGGLTHQP
ncbi:ABC transporter substrate-binding protein [Aerophototrophica crusticola]|uniref:ABC transporter substrate-binding protein n=1 Tax=Aerophototrophica crusticola TaxID=1709002 RepID=A0A858RBQ9_9PROT|nr:ABC transporter substrate-binding protein [Rhodospirillaceae bacterium B3]